jgi:dihydrodipicolinate synthase/N-acetylneuraminate lyase
MPSTVLDPLSLLRPRRRITGMSAVLLPFLADGAIDWPSYRAHVARTAGAGLAPAANMDTGYGPFLDDPTRQQVLNETRAAVEGAPFVAGAFVADRPGDRFDADAYRRAIDLVHQYGGTPIIFQSYGLTGLQGEELVEAYRSLGRDCARFLAFELGQAFAPFGRIYSLEEYAGLLEIPACFGAKHSSLSRALEWERLRLRDERRPEFLVLTGNDLAIDMVTYGSDYLLGLSTFAPDLFALRDRFWEAGDPQFYELNDLLQYLGCFAFRAPVPAYKHSAAQLLKLQGWIETDRTHPASPERPAYDRGILAEIVRRLDSWRGRG